jgi:hypothetical protein
VKKPTKTALAERIAANRRGNALTPEQDAAILAAYLAKPLQGVRPPSYRSLASEFGYSVGTIVRAIRRASEAS